MNRRYAALTLALAAIAITGCSSSDPQPTETSAGASQCQDVSAELMAAIAEGANQIPIEPVAAAAIEWESPLGAGYLVAMSFTDDDGNSPTGLWAVSSLEASDAPPILSADPMADLYTDWPHEVKGAELDPGAAGDTAKECLS